MIQRFRCTGCRSTFSHATDDPRYYQKKRQCNTPLIHLLGSGVSQRRSAKILCINRKTVVRKLLFLAAESKKEIVEINFGSPLVEVLEFDDLETYEHTKLKPLSVICAVETKTRRILALGVAQMPAKGNLAKLSVAKYGKRKDERPRVRRELFNKLQKFVHPHAIIKSDENGHYRRDLKNFFPEADHQTFKGRKSTPAGLGELKKGYDPIFSIDHTFAMMRANVNRLFRRTWNTTKRPDRLEAHLYLYALYHNVDLRFRELQPR